MWFIIYFSFLCYRRQQHYLAFVASHSFTFCNSIRHLRKFFTQFYRPPFSINIEPRWGSNETSSLLYPGLHPGLLILYPCGVNKISLKKNFLNKSALYSLTSLLPLFNKLFVLPHHLSNFTHHHSIFSLLINHFEKWALRLEFLPLWGS
jgi:hypothetical protein